MDLRELLCEIAASFFSRGYAFGSTGNLSIRTGDQIWITPTGESLRNLTPDRLALIDLTGQARNANRASKEAPFHLAAYRAAGERASAIVHLHSTYSTALSCLADLSEVDPLPPITPYYRMRVSPLRVLPYFRPGSADLAAAVENHAAEHNCLLLRNHGAICLGGTLNEAVDRAEELEETARLYFLLQGHDLRYLKREELTEIDRVFRSR